MQVCPITGLLMNKETIFEGVKHKPNLSGGLDQPHVIRASRHFGRFYIAIAANGTSLLLLEAEMIVALIIV